jgi:hypothetical protein
MKASPNKNKFTLKRDVYLPWELLDSEAYKTLSATGIRVLIRFFQKRTWSDIGKGRQKKRVYKNSGIAFTYAEANALGTSTSQFHVTIKKLFAVGFIDIEHQGGGLARDYSRYSISERWRDFGTSNFKQVIKSRVLQRGLDVQSRMMRKTNKATENRSCQLRETVVIGAGI